MTERDRKSDYDNAYSQAWSTWGAWQSQIKSDLRAYGGDPWTARDRQIAKMRDRELLHFPQLRRVVKWVTGYEREHRLAITFDPQEGGDEQTASQLSAVGLWVLQYNNGYYILSSAFEGALKTGINLVNIYNDRNLDTGFDCFRYNQFLLDETFTRVDLRDCQFGILRKYVDPATARMLLPDKDSLIEDLTKQSGVDEKFSNYPKPTLYGQRLLSYDEFQQRTTEDRKIIIFKPTMEERIFRGTTAELDELIFSWAQQGIPPELISIVRRKESTTEVTCFLEGKEVRTGIDPYGLDDFSFTPVICYLDPEQDDMTMKLQSFVHGLIDSQRASDKKMMSMIAWVEQQIGAGLDYEEGSLVDDEDAFKTGSGSPRVFKANAIRDTRYRDRVVPDIPPGLFQLWDSITAGIPKMANINEEMFGFPAKGAVKIAGVLAKLRLGAGLVGLRDIYDHRSWSVKCIGLKMAKLIQQYPPSKVQRIINKQPSKAFYSRDFGKYDCVVAEGMLSDTQRAMAYAEMVALKELGIRIQEPCPITWKRILEMAPIQQKDELLQDVAQVEQQRQQAAAKQQQFQEAVQKLAIARGMAEIRQQDQLAEQQRTGAIENQTEAAFDRVQTIAKLKEIENKNTIELLKIAASLEKEKIKAQGKEVEE